MQGGAGLLVGPLSRCRRVGRAGLTSRQVSCHADGRRVLLGLGGKLCPQAGDAESLAAPAGGRLDARGASLLLRRRAGRRRRRPSGRRRRLLPPRHRSASGWPSGWSGRPAGRSSRTRSPAPSPRGRAVASGRAMGGAGGGGQPGLLEGLDNVERGGGRRGSGHGLNRPEHELAAQPGHLGVRVDVRLVLKSVLRGPSLAVRLAAHGGGDGGVVLWHRLVGRRLAPAHHNWHHSAAAGRGQGLDGHLEWAAVPPLDVGAQGSDRGARSVHACSGPGTGQRLSAGL
mmetsp:Transcript_6833/g.27971  ORF Transcript_6833/g.27971 Transcript_6833/m.27971 type:complete len:285 (+) Transcript_6833:832-1686(+)